MAAVNPPLMPMSANSTHKMALPVIRHPMSRKGDVAALTVNGGLRGREQTFVTIREGGKLDLGLDRSSLPALSRNGSSASDQQTTPFINAGHGGDLLARNLSDKGKFRRSIDTIPKVGTKELENLIQEKLTTEYHGIKHMFKSGDPNGQGAVSREALQKILRNLVGFLANDQYHKLLKRMKLDQKSQITFEEFVSYFKEDETAGIAWLQSPAHKVAIAVKRPPRGLEDHLRCSLDQLKENRPIKATLAHVMLKERLKHKAAEIDQLLPEACRGADALVLPPHLSELLVKLNIHIGEVEFKKLWQKYDKNESGAIKASQLLATISGIEDVSDRHANVPDGRKEDLQKLPPLAEFLKTLKHKKDGSHTARPLRTTHQPPDVTTKPKSSLAGSIRHIQKKMNSPQKLQNIIDALHYKFEVGYYALLMGMQCLDFLGDGFISRLDMKRVLEEFGLRISAMNLEQFIKKLGIQCNGGQAPYREFLVKFWNKGEGTLVDRIITSNSHALLPPKATELNIEEIEAALVEFLHKDFLNLLQSLRQCDKHKMGLLPAHQFRDMLEKVAGYSMTEAQWESVKSKAGQDKDGLIPYLKFLEIFTSGPPGSWNKRDYCGVMVVKVRQRDPHPAINTLQELAKNQAVDRQQGLEKLKEDTSEVISMELKTKIARNIEELQKSKNGRSLKVLKRIMQEVFKLRFSAVDKAFKAQDRRMTGRICKQQFQDIMATIDVQLLPTESDAVWGSCDLSADGMMSFTSMVHQFTDFDKVLDMPPPRQTSDYNDGDFHGRYSYAYRNVALDDIPELDSESLKTLNEIRQKVQLLTPSTQGGSTRQSGVVQSARGSQSLTDLLNKVEPEIRKYLQKLKPLLLHMDKHRTGTILGQDMKEIVTTLHLPLSREEVRRLLNAYDIDRDGHFHYRKFVQHFVTSSEMDLWISNDRNIDATSQKWVMTERSWHTQIIKTQKLVKRAFKKADVSGEGVVSVKQFKEVLKSCSIDISPEDFYNILSEFDSNLNGKISYKEFLSQIFQSV